MVCLLSQCFGKDLHSYSKSTYGFVLEAWAFVKIVTMGPTYCLTPNNNHAPFIDKSDKGMVNVTLVHTCYLYSYVTGDFAIKTVV